MKKHKPLEAGQKYGKLTVIGYNSEKSSLYKYWNCICDCGKYTSVIGNGLKQGRITSCGCNHSNARKKSVTYDINENGCWICTSHYKDEDGYPHICINYKHKTVCRFYYEKYKGPIPDNMLVCHTCDTPECINPEHLFLGTKIDNVEDRVKKLRSSSKFTKEQIIEIRNSTDTQIAIAKKYGAHKRTICSIRNRETWKHVF